HFAQKARIYDLLTVTEEVSLAKEIEVGVLAQERIDKQQGVSRREIRELRHLVSRGHMAKERFIVSNLRLVLSISRNYLGRGMDYIDMVQEGNIGLMRAVEKFDYQQG